MNNAPFTKVIDGKLYVGHATGRIAVFSRHGHFEGTLEEDCETWTPRVTLEQTNKMLADALARRRS